MPINLTNVLVADQAKALRFYTELLGPVKRQDDPAGERRFLTVVSPEAPDGGELWLEPSDTPAARSFQRALYAQALPATAFVVDGLQPEYDRLSKLGVVFRTPPAETEAPATAVFDDTCSNLMQLDPV